MRKYGIGIFVVGVLLCVAVGIVIHTCTREGNVSTDAPPDGSQCAIEAPQLDKGAPRHDKFVKIVEKETPEAPAVSAQEMVASDIVKTIIGLRKDAKNYRKRAAAISSLTKSLPGNDVAALREFLVSKDGGEGMRPIEFNALKNDVLDVLLRQEQVPVGLGGQLVQMFLDRDYDPIWRDYCAQYFAVYYQKRWNPKQEVAKDDQERQAMESAYWVATSEKHSTVAGTALLGLEWLSRDYPEFDREEVASRAGELASDESACEATRITAMRVCALTGNDNVLPVARILAQTGETMPMRMAAVATLGDIGDSDDIELVASLSKAEDQRLRTVALASAERLHERMAQ